MSIGIDNSLVCFWDFDGVIKDSVSAKTKAFKKLFMSYGNHLATRVQLHHESNCGISRYEKIPLYLEWAGEKVTDEKIERYCSIFSEEVVKAVISSPWVPGVYEYLLKNYKKQYFVIVTATPQEEIEKILSMLNIRQCFREIFGTPTKKEEAIRLVLKNQKIMASQAIVIGDSVADLYASEINSVPFLLRRTSINIELQNRFEGRKFDNLIYE